MLCWQLKWRREMSLLVPSFVLLFVSPLISCSASLRNQRSQPVPGDSVLASVEGISKEDQSLDGISYHLLCDGKQEVTGQLTKLGEKELISFKTKEILDGDSCALEVRAKPQKDIVWLTNPVTEGLYYASSKGIVKARKLQLKLYKVYRKKSDPSSDLSVSTDDGGTCAKFILEERSCKDVPDEPSSENGACVLLDVTNTALACFEPLTRAECESQFKKQTDPAITGFVFYENESCTDHSPGSDTNNEDY